MFHGQKNMRPTAATIERTRNRSHQEQQNSSTLLEDIQFALHNMPTRESMPILALMGVCIVMIIFGCSMLFDASLHAIHDYLAPIKGWY